MVIERIKNSDGLISGFTVDGSTYTLKIPISDLDLNSAIKNTEPLLLVDDTWFAFNSGGGTSSKSQSVLLKYVLENNKLVIGSELTESDDSIPDSTGNKGFLTSPTANPLLDFYKAFAYNEENYKLMVNSENIEVSFLCSDRRYGVAGSRRAWSPYFKIRDLIKQSFTNIQNILIGSDASPEYFFKAKVEVRSTGDLFITFIDGHAGVNLFGAILNIRHRVV